ncbi:Calcineurin-like phosphoesterase [Carpediemonas membranifera]|uniref:Calcineurin-like phosphoesterase n=1 Tax=Carpediemonas membranifera TaxID=201153 RepID=A0A8J6BUE8_9EUKA|nr:Calcineurin-like phosphoesterase [Carpediemonas membranifera]|eukprot:KAG9390276.1 Calcineurin-like phosphoesterase [Carpediemonas membranifera]
MFDKFCVLILVLTACVAAEYNVLVVNDIHYSQRYNERSSRSSWCETSIPTAVAAPYGRYRCDAPMKLITSTLDAMVSVDPEPDLLIIGGDFGGHTALSLDEITQSIQAVTGEIKRRFPHTSTFPVIGNDDVFPDYKLDAGQLNTLANIWADWLSADELATFKTGGYYKREVSASLHVIVLNTLLVIPQNTMTSAATHQWTWFAAELAASTGAGARVVLVMHIPPGVNGYDQTDPWTTEDFDAFTAIVAQYSGVISGIYAFHEHTDLHRAFEGTFMLISPSVTPAFGNNPSFRTMCWDAQGGLADVIQFYLDLPRASIDGAAHFVKEYSMAEEYGQYMAGGRFSAQSAEALQARSMSDGAFWTTYYNRMKAENSASGRASFACAMVVSDERAFSKCLQSFPFKN